MVMITLSGICKTYAEAGDKVQALCGIDLTVQEGEFIAIVGQSGSGKSTLMNILGCLDMPSAGSYLLREQDVTAAAPGQRALIRNRKIGFIFQGYNLAPRLTAMENVELPLMFRGIPQRERRRLSEAALEAVGLGERCRHYPSQLSGGQQQRVAIARAIAARPSLILADEPTGSLDRASSDACMSLLTALHHAGHTIILITHDLHCAVQAQRIITLQDGRIVENGVG